MYILNQDGDNLINLDKVTKVYIQFSPYENNWELRVLYSISSGTLEEIFDVVGKYSSEKECKSVLDSILVHLKVIYLN